MDLRSFVKGMKNCDLPRQLTAPITTVNVIHKSVDQAMTLIKNVDFKKNMEAD